MKRRRYAIAAVVALAGFGALLMVLPARGAGKSVHLVGTSFRPASITIRAGRAITFYNDSTLTHTATCPKCHLDSGDIQPGAFKTLTFPRAGTYELVCRYHGDQGMVASLTVTP